MHSESVISNETKAARAFGRQAMVFDDLYGGDAIIQYKRTRVREQVQGYLAPHSDILELNAGTGEDAVFFALQGHKVHATDISADMLKVLSAKIVSHKLAHLVSNETCSYTALTELQQKGPYDHIFSNFAGLNCTGELDKVLLSFSALLKPGGMVTLVLMPRFCGWEFLLLFRGKFKTAFRRITAANGARAKVEEHPFTCWYYSPSYIIHCLQKEFTLLKLEGLCTLVPPSYMTGFAEKYPKAFRFLQKLEGRWKEKWPWKCIGDYYIISLRRKS